MASISMVTKQSRRTARAAETLSAGSVEVWGETIYYEAAGQAEDGPTVLFLHEAGGTAATWQGQLTGLAQDARCLVPDLPGHGRSVSPGCTTVSEYRQAVLGFLDALAIRWPVVLAGVCLGAAVAVDLALHAPDRVAGLVLAGVTDGGRACDRVRSATAVGEAPERFVTSLFGTAPPPRLVREQLQRWRNTNPSVRHGDLVAAAAYPMGRALRGVSHPVLLVAGEQDSIAPPAAVRNLVEGETGLPVSVVPGAGCLAMLEAPGAFNRLVARFLAEQGSVRPFMLEETWRSGGYRRFV